MVHRSWPRPLPTGYCWCGCHAEISTRAFFVQGHDKVAESKVILAEYGSVADFLAALGYGPGGKNPREASSNA
jgi:hypothetical protein